jgi:hypothetical protein
VHVIPDCVTVNVLPAMVSVPVRDAVDVLAAVEKLTVPLPAPVAPAVTVIQLSLLTAVQLQPVGAVTAVLPVAPPEATDCDVGEIVSVHVIPACVTVNVLPAIVSVPVRDDVELFAAVEKLTVPFPEPVAPEVTVIQPTLLAAVQLHAAGAVTAVLPVPPADATLCDVGEIVSLQVVPAWVTVNVLPAIVSVPVREDVDALEAAENVTVPLPVPLLPAVIVNHATLLTAVHVQAVPAITAVLPAPPPADMEKAVGEIVGAQGTEKENVFEGRLLEEPPGPIAATRPS